MSDNPLSPDEMAVLRAIHERGTASIALERFLPLSIGALKERDICQRLKDIECCELDKGHLNRITDKGRAILAAQEGKENNG